MSDLEDLLARIEQWDAEGNRQAIADAFATRGLDEIAIINVLQLLLVNEKLTAAFSVYEYLAERGLGGANFIVGFAQALKGLLTGDLQMARDGLVIVSFIIDGLSADTRDSIFRSFFLPAVRHPVLLCLVHKREEILLRLLDLFKAADPLMRTTFDFDQPPVAVDIAAMWARGIARQRLLPYEGPPAGTRRSTRRVAVAMPRLYIPTAPASRLNDTGPLICDTMRRYGWQADFHGMEFAPSAQAYLDEFLRIVDFCEAMRADMLVFDDIGVKDPLSHPLRSHFLSLLRQRLPSLTVVGAYLDSWVIPEEILIHAAETVDVVWAYSPSLPVFGHEAFRGKLFTPPLPRGPYADPDRPVPPLPARMVFPGGISEASYHRAFWLAAANWYGLAMDKVVSTHMSDDLDVVDSFRAYCNRLVDSGCVLNLAMRPDHSLPITGRAFEATMNGALLIQEAAPDVDYYFIAGEHYIEFKTFADLRAVADFIAGNREEAEAVRRRGAAFARDRYSGEKVVGYLDEFLYRMGR